MVYILSFLLPLVLLLTMSSAPAHSSAAQQDNSRTFTLFYDTKFGGLKTVIPPELNRQPRIGLALAGGGARAAAALGVLKVLRDEGIPIAAIAGTSMGSVVGGFAAAGYTPEEIKRIFLENRWNDLFTDTPPRSFLPYERKKAENRHLLQFSFTGGRFIAPAGLTAGQKLTNLLMIKTLSASFQSGLDFDRLPIPFRAVAADLETGEVVAIRNGQLHDAIRASSSIPVLYPPVELHGRLLVDGGLANNLPVDVVRSMGMDMVIAVDASAPLVRKDRLTSLVEIMSQSVSIPVRRETAKQASLADILVLPDTGDFSFADFDRLEEIIRIGEQAAREAMPGIVKRIAQMKRGSSDERYILSGITVQGNHTIPADVVLSAFAQPFSRSWTEGELMNCLAAASRIGSFADITLVLTPRNGVHDAVIFVDEHPVVEGIRISGTSLIPAGEIMDELEGQLGAPLNPENVHRALERIVKRYRDNGYLLVHVERAGMLPDNRTLSIVIREGRLDSLQLSGHRRTAMSMIRRETKTELEKPINFKILTEDIQHLYGLNYYETLNADIIENDAGGVDLTFKVKEKPRGSVRLGLRYDLEDAFTGLTDLVIDNLFGKGVQFATQARYGNYTDITMGYHSPVLINTSFVHRLAGFYRDRTYSLYQNKERTGALEVSRIGFDLSFGYQWFHFGDTYLRYRYSSDRQIGIYGVTTQENPLQTGSLAILTAIDTRDSSIFPRSGVLFKGSYETASSVYGGDGDFRKTTLGGQFAIPLADRFTVIADGIAGLGSGSLAYQEQYGLGGIDALISAPLPGYQRREFVGANMIGATLGCRWRISEYQLRAVKAVYVSTTGGMGNVWENRDAISSRTVLTGGSIGLHADTIVGPLQLEFGAGEGSRFHVHFSAGFEY